MATIGAFGAIFDDKNRMLLVLQAYGPKRWTQPGGRLQENESPMAAVVREVFEETGMRCEVSGFCGTYLASYKDDVVLMFRLRVLAATPWHPNEEIAAVQYFAHDALPHNMAFNTRTRVLQAFGPHPCGLTVFETPDTAQAVFPP